MQRRTVEYTSGDTEVRIVVSEATALAGMKRAILRGRVDAYLGAVRGNDESASVDTIALELMARVVYPDLLACTVEADGIDLDALDVGAFCELPDALVDAWEAAVYELNPHWLPSVASTDEERAQEKKEPPTSG